MGSLSIEDLDKDSRLDKAAMREIRGGQVARLNAGLSALQNGGTGSTCKGTAFARLREQQMVNRKRTGIVDSSNQGGST